jgi:hypothetical protein
MATRTTLTLLALVSAMPASAQTVHRPFPYGPAYAGSDGFAGEFVRGTYIGAPLTRVPRPTEIVPSPWSYGTYGVPTVTGIAAPPAAQPTLTVINGTPANGRRRASAVEDGPPGGPQIIAVRVPRR